MTVPNLRPSAGIPNRDVPITPTGASPGGEYDQADRDVLIGRQMERVWKTYSGFAAAGTVVKISVPLACEWIVITVWSSSSVDDLYPVQIGNGDTIVMLAGQGTLSRYVCPGQDVRSVSLGAAGRIVDVDYRVTFMTGYDPGDKG